MPTNERGMDFFHELQRVTVAYCEMNGLPVPNVLCSDEELERIKDMVAPQVDTGINNPANLAPASAATHSERPARCTDRGWCDDEYACTKAGRCLYATDEAEAEYRKPNYSPPEENSSEAPQEGGPRAGQPSRRQVPGGDPT